MLSKKGVSILPFFALQLVSIMIFFIVLLSLLTMAKNVNYVINEFDEQTASLLAERRLLSSADCLAYEEIGVMYDPISEQVLYGRRVFPGVVDKNKLLDFENVNCMRKDLYEKYDELKNGLVDAREGSGAGFKYSVLAFDAVAGDPESPGEFVGFPDTTTFNEHFIDSTIVRVNKYDGDCRETLDTTDNCAERYGGDFDCLSSCDRSDYKDTWCKNGRCEDRNKDGIDWARPYWEFHDPKYTVYPVDGVAEGDPNNYVFKLTQRSDSCSGSDSASNSIFPLMMNVNGELHPSYVVINTCVLKGAKYEGLNVLSINVKPQPGEECVG